MLIPRRGQSPARGLAKNGNDPTNDESSGRTGTDFSEGGPIDLEEQPRDETWNRRADRGSGTLLRRDRYSPVSQDVERPPRGAEFPQVISGSLSQRQPRQHDISHTMKGGMDHYSPPPEDEDEPSKHISSTRYRASLTTVSYAFVFQGGEVYLHHVELGCVPMIFLRINVCIFSCFIIQFAFRMFHFEHHVTF